MRRSKLEHGRLVIDRAPSLAEFTEQEWDEGFSRKTYRLLRDIEGQPVKPRSFGMIRERGKTIAEFVEMHVQNSPSAAQRLLGRTAFILGLPGGGGDGLRFADDAPVEACFADVAGALRRIAARDGRAFVLVVAVREQLAERFRAAGYQTSPAPAQMVLALPGRYDEYLHRLRPRHRRDLGRMRRRAESSGITFTRPDELGDPPSAYFALLLETLAKHGIDHAASPYDENFLARLKERRGRGLQLFVAKKDGVMVAYFAVVRDPAAAKVLMPGLHYAVTRPHGIYFLLWQEVIEWSIAQGLPVLHGGTLMEREKARLGFEPRPAFYCYAASVKWLDPAVARLRPFLESRVLDADLKGDKTEREADEAEPAAGGAQ